MTRLRVLDSNGQLLSPCEASKGIRLVAAGAAEYVACEPNTIRLLRPIEITKKRLTKPVSAAGERLLLHVCCGPCATYTSKHLRELGWDVTGYWYNPNIEPGDEYDRRLASMRHLAAITQLAMTWDITSSSDDFRELVAGHERFGERCQICYRLRLRRTAQVAVAQNIAVITTSLLISPYQNLTQLRTIGEEEAQAQGLRFYYENMRSGYQERTQLALDYGLYLQSYCGCSFSQQETEQRRALKRNLVPNDGVRC